MQHFWMVSRLVDAKHASRISSCRVGGVIGLLKKLDNLFTSNNDTLDAWTFFLLLNVSRWDLSRRRRACSKIDVIFLYRLCLFE